MKKVLLVLMFLAAVLVSRAQIAGLSALSVLDMTQSARTAGFGFDYLSVYDDDINLTIDNPSLLDGRFTNQLSVNYVNMFAGANFGSLAYSYDFEHLGAFTFALRFDSYGSFSGYDEYEQPTFDFSASDYVFSIGWGRHIDSNFSIGANFKPVLSQYESYTALSFAIDIAGSYVSRDKRLAATVMGRNIGAQVFTFDGTSEKLPFELSASGSYKLEQAPVRFLFALTELQRWNLRYADPLNPTSTTDAFTGEVTEQSAFAGFCDNLGRHINIGAEITVKNIVFLRLGYSYRQMAEMRAADVINMSGFSFGLGIKVKGFELCYARNNYHLMQAPNFISVTTDIDRFFR